MMRMDVLTVCVMSLLVLSVSLAGCSSNSTATPNEKGEGSPTPLASEAGHDSHDHGDQAGHVYPTEGPHGGHLIELGNEEYHGELLHDEKTDTVTIHLLDGPAKQTVAVVSTEITLQLFQDGQFVKYALKPVHGPEDAADVASRFEIVDASLCNALCHGDETRGRLQVTIDGKPYTGTIEHGNHGTHDEGHELNHGDSHDQGAGHDHGEAHDLGAEEDHAEGHDHGEAHDLGAEEDHAEGHDHGDEHDHAAP